MLEKEVFCTPSFPSEAKKELGILNTVYVRTHSFNSYLLSEHFFLSFLPRRMKLYLKVRFLCHPKTPFKTMSAWLIWALYMDKT